MRLIRINTVLTVTELTLGGYSTTKANEPWNKTITAPTTFVHCPAHFRSLPRPISFTAPPNFVDIYRLIPDKSGLCCERSHSYADVEYCMPVSQMDSRRKITREIVDKGGDFVTVFSNGRIFL